MKTIGLIAPNYGRIKILSLYCASIKRLREDLGVYIPAVIVSEASDKQICDRYGIAHVEYPNNPVSNKFNRGLAYMRSIGVDYCTVMGSDDIISTETYERIAEEAEKGYDLIGVSTVYFYATDGRHKGQMVKLDRPGKILGVGKTISSRVLDKVDWRPWNIEKNWGLDGMAQATIKPFVTTSKVIDNAMIVDCKSSTNINKATYWIGQKIKKQEDPEEFYSILGAEEKRILKDILK